MKTCLRILLAIAAAAAVVCLAAAFLQRLKGTCPEKEYVSIDVE